MELAAEPTVLQIEAENLLVVEGPVSGEPQVTFIIVDESKAEDCPDLEEDNGGKTVLQAVHDSDMLEEVVVMEPEMEEIICEVQSFNIGE